MEQKPTYWDYIKGKIWWIIILVIYFIFKSNSIPSNIRIGYYFGILFGLIFMLGIFYLLYRNKLSNYKKEINNKK
jgi:hypothetical protein